MPPHHDRSSPPPIPLAEKWLIAVVALELCFMPWALGGMQVWSQSIALCLSALSLALALIPRPGADVRSRLLRFPIFWLGAAFLLIIVVQGLNPAWRYVRVGGVWWITPVPHLALLPHGIATPFAVASPWRCLMIDSSAWLAVCASWTGFTRRRSVIRLFTALAMNACALAVFGIFEKVLAAPMIYWFWQPPELYFVSSFVYKNHAGAYFVLLLGLCAGLVARRIVRGRSPGAMDLAPVLVVSVAALAVIVLLSNSRGAALTMAAFFASIPLLLAAAGVIRGSRLRKAAIVALFYAAVAGTAGLAIHFAGSPIVVGRVEAMVSDAGSDVPGPRLQATRATLDMFRADPVYGWGADAFRYAFPPYQSAYPLIYREPSQFFRRYYFEHAHDDYAEFLAEFGLVGALFPVAMLIFWARHLARHRFWLNPCLLLVLTGCALTLVHAAADFPFHNPAILLTWCALLAGSSRWAELESA